MGMISMIISGLALLAASVCLVAVCREKKRSKKRNAALIRYIDRAAKAASDGAGRYAETHVKKLWDQIEGPGNILDRIGKLEQGITPDYEAAKQAADAVNDFSKGITNILGFDPMEALKAERQKATGELE